MGKRSNFERNPRDHYDTPRAAVEPLIPHLPTTPTRYWEPCFGNGMMVVHLSQLAPTLILQGASDYVTPAETTQYPVTDMFITNPPWDRKLLHPIIENLSDQAPTWLLFDADWMHTRQAAPYLPRCELIVSVGRVKWVANSKHTATDTRFVGR